MLRVVKGYLGLNFKHDRGDMILDDLGHIDVKASIKSSAADVPLRNKGGRPKGYDGTRAKQPSAMSIAFKKAGLDWKEDFALAIKNNKRERIKLWLKLLPYMITTSSKARVRKWKGRPSKAAMIALETLEGRNE